MISYDGPRLLEILFCVLLVIFIGHVFITKMLAPILSAS